MGGGVQRGRNAVEAIRASASGLTSASYFEAMFKNLDSVILLSFPTKTLPPPSVQDLPQGPGLLLETESPQGTNLKSPSDATPAPPSPSTHEGLHVHVWGKTQYLGNAWLLGKAGYEPKISIPKREREGKEQTSLRGEWEQKLETDLKSSLSWRRRGLAAPKCPAKAVIFISLSFIQGGRLSRGFDSVFS